MVKVKTRFYGEDRKNLWGRYTTGKQYISALKVADWRAFGTEIILNNHGNSGCSVRMGACIYRMGVHRPPVFTWPGSSVIVSAHSKHTASYQVLTENVHSLTPGKYRMVVFINNKKMDGPVFKVRG